MDADSQPRGEEHADGTPPLAATAAEWVTRRNAGLDESRRQELRSWLSADVRNAAAFARADAAGTELDWPLHAGKLDEILSGLAWRAARRQFRQRVGVAGGAFAAIAMVIVLFSRGSSESPALSPPPGRTLIVKTPQRQTLPDGSLVDLKEGAQIAVAFSADARLVVLSKGTAHFQVTKSSRPFIVTASGITAEALGTAFSVEMDAGKVSILVTAGRVAVNTDRIGAWAPEVNAASGEAHPTTVLEAGKAVSISTVADAPPLASPIVAVPPVEVENRLSWRVPLLEFNGTPLSEIVAILNRNNHVQFVIADSSLSKLTLSGVLRADKVDALVDLLESEFQVRAVRRSGQIVLETAPVRGR